MYQLIIKNIFIFTIILDTFVDNIIFSDKIFIQYKIFF